MSKFVAPAKQSQPKKEAPKESKPKAAPAQPTPATPPQEDAAPKPAAKPKDPLAELPPSKMIMDSWKRLYSNTPASKFNEICINGLWNGADIPGSPTNEVNFCLSAVYSSGMTMYGCFKSSKSSCIKNL